jgi:hypothetical protein
MSVQIQYLRGSNVQLDAFTGAQAEIVVNTTDYTLRVMDGATQGGFPLVGTTQVQTLSNKTLVSPVITGTVNLPGNVSAGNVFSNGYFFANGVPFSSFSNVDVGNYLRGNVVVDIIPAANVTYSLGNSTNQWLDLWISNSTIYMNSIPINLSGNNLQVNGANLMPQNSNLVLTSGGITTAGAISANTIAGNTLSITGNVAFANITTNALSVTTLTASGNITANNLASLNGISGELTTPTQPNITSLGVLSALTVGPTGIITSGPVTAATLGGSLTTAAQPNVTSVGTLTNLTASGNITSTAGNISAGNIIATTALVAVGLSVTGNVDAGNVNAVGQANVGSVNSAGTGTFGGNVSTPNVFTQGAYWLSNAQPILTSNGNLFVGNASVTGSLTTTGNINTPALNWSNGTPIISPTGNLNVVNINASGRANVTGNITSGGNIAAQNFIGNGAFLTGIQTQTANTAIQVTGNTQSNITQVGTLTTLNVAGTITAVAFFGDGGFLSNINLANTVGVVANANYSLNANNAVFSGTVTTNAQPNITSVGTLTSLAVTGGITGDTVSAAVIGNIGADFIGNSVSVLQVGNAGTNFTGTLDANSAIQSNITTVGNLTLLDVVNRVTAASFAGDGGYLANIVGANVTGTVANANYALFGNASVYSTYANVANTVADNAQPNVTSVGTLLSLGVTGNITTSNTGNINAGAFFTGDGAGISNIRGAIVTGIVANANYALFGNASVYSTYANVANTVNDAAQPNITSVGTLTSLTVTGDVTAATFTGNIVTANQPNITNVGTLTSLAVTGNATANNISAGLVTGTLTTAAQPNITSTGTLVSLVVTGNVDAGNVNSIFYGNGAGISALTGANVTGTVANANYSLFSNASVFSTRANVANTVADNAQPNITSVGTLGSLSVTNNINANGITITGNSIFDNAIFNGSVILPGNITQISGNQGQFFGNSTGANALYAGISAGYNLQEYTVFQATANNDDYAQINFQNINSGGKASTDFVATADNGTFNSNFVAMGIASSNWDDSSANTIGNVINKNDSYLYSQGVNAAVQGGNLILGAATAGKFVKIIAGGGSTDDVVAEFGINDAYISGNLNLTGPGNIITVGNTTAAYYFGNASTLSGIIPQAAVANTVNDAAQPNITSVGNLVSLQVNNNVNAASFTGSLTTNAQPNITSLGTLTSLGVTGGVTAATFTGNIVTANQPNITNVGTLTSLTVSGNATANVFIGNGAGLTNILGSSIVGNITGNVSNAAVAAAVGGGANNQILFQTGTSATGFAVAPVTASTYLKWDGNTFAWDAVAASSLANPLTFDNLGNGVVPGTAYNATVANTISYNTIGAAAANGVNATGTWTINTTGHAATVSANAQPNITSVGNLVSLQVNGGVNATSFTGSGAFLTSVPGANVTGIVLNANNAIQAQQATIAGTAFRADFLIQANQPNLTQFGTLVNLTVNGTTQVTTINSSGNATLAAVVSDNYFYANGQPLFGSTGTVSAGNIVATGTSTVSGNSNAANFNTAGGVNSATVTTTGNATIGSGLTVNGTTTFNNTVNGTTINAAAIGNAGTTFTGATLTTSGDITTSGGQFIGAGTGLTGTALGLTAGAVDQEVTFDNSGAGAATGATFDGSAARTISYNTVGAPSITGTNASGLWGINITGYAATVSTAAQPNITSVGTLTSLAVTGAITSGSTITATGNVIAPFFTGTAVTAQYADLAESYVGDHKYAPGTVVSFGGANEVTQSVVDGDRRVAGVVSTNPAYLMNSELHDPNTVAVALTGRVPCRVTGTVRKGDLMVSAGDGSARAEEDPRAGSIIGKALADFDGVEGVIEVVVGRF